MGKRLIGLLLLAIVVVVPTLSQSCDSTTGTTERHDYFSDRLGQTMFYTVYTPPCYDENAPAYPVIYLKHGSNDDDNHWIRLGIVDELNRRIASGAMIPTVVVFPFGNVIANRNRFDNLSWATIFLNELMPDAETNYNISSEPSRRAIGGISRGGFWAYQIAFSHPDLFGTVGGHSAFFDLHHAPDEHNPLDLALSESAVTDMTLWLDRGANDYAAPGLDIMGERLTEAGVQHIYTIYPEGQHNNVYWGAHITDYLDFYSDALRPQTPAQQPPNLFVTNTPQAPPAIATATPTPNLTEQTQGSAPLVYPVVAFPSLITTIDASRLSNIANGMVDSDLLLTPETITLLEQAGYTISDETQTVERAELQAALWNDRNKFTLLPIEQLNPRLRIIWVDDIPVLDHAAYPFEGSSEPTPTRITLSGVTALTRETRTALNDNDIEWAASGIQYYVRASDIFHTSNEVSVYEDCPQWSSQQLGSMCTEPEHIELLSLVGVDVVELSGNHNNDYGYDAYRETLTYYQDNGYITIGGGETVTEARTPYITTLNGTTVAMLACNSVGPYYAFVNEQDGMLGGIRPGAAPCDWEWLEAALPRLSAQVDIVTVTIQYLEREVYTPSTQQRFDFRRMANLGADVVMGTSAHKPQTYEFYNTDQDELAFIHYGMGNLFFDQPWWGNRRFFMNTLYLHDGELKSVEIFPGIIDDLARPRLMTAEERLNFLQFMFQQQNGF